MKRKLYLEAFYKNPDYLKKNDKTYRQQFYEEFLIEDESKRKKAIDFLDKLGDFTEKKVHDYKSATSKLNVEKTKLKKQIMEEKRDAIFEEVKDDIESSKLEEIYVCPDPSELGIYKSFNYEIFERRNSIVIAFDGNSPVSNLIQEAKNGKGEAKIYVNSDVEVLKEKAKTLDGYVKVFNKNINLSDVVLEDNPEIKGDKT